MQLQNHSGIQNISIYFSLRNKFFRSIGAALIPAVNQADIFSMFLHLGLDGEQQIPKICFIMQKLEIVRGANENI